MVAVVEARCLPAADGPHLPAPPACRPEEERARAVAAVEGKMPRRVKRKRPIVLDDGSQPGGMEEYYDYIFPVGCWDLGR